MRKLLSLLMLISVASIHSQIKGGSGSIGGTAGISGTAPAATSLALTPALASQVVNTSLGFTAIATLSNGLTTKITKLSTWTTSNAAIAAIGTPTDTQAINCVSAGTAQITATYGNISGSTTITCTPAVPPAPTLVSIAVTPASPSISVGSVQGFTATGTYSDGSTQDVTAASVWASGTPANASLGSLTATQSATCLKGGTSSISATIGSVSASVTLTCNAVLTSITVTPASPQTNAGTAQNFIATGNYNDGSSADVTLQATWSSGTPATATIAARADPQPANCLIAGTSVITATVGVVSGTSTLTCLAVGPPPPSLVSITVTPASPTVNVGKTLGLIATCHYSDGSTKDCTISQGNTNTAWTSGSPSKISLSSPVVDPEIATGIAAGTSLITASNGVITGSTTVTVQTPGPTLVSIAVTPNSPTQFVNSSVGFTATGTFSDGTTQDVTSQANWTSGTLGVAVIASASNPQNVNCVSAGTSLIIAMVGAVSGSQTLTCQAVVPPSLGMDAYCTTGNVCNFGANDGPATPPQAGYYTDPSSRPTSGTVRSVTAGTWNSVWAATACDDVVEMPQGSTFVGTFTIPAGTPCAAGHYRTLRVNGFNSNFPAYGQGPVSPHYWGIASLPGYPSFGSAPVANVGATIQSTGTNSALVLTAGYDGLQIEGVRVTRTPATGFISALIQKGAGAHLILDRFLCAGTTGDETNRCLNIDGVTYFAAINSTFLDFNCKSGGAACDGQAISGGLNNTGIQDGIWKIVGDFGVGSGQGLLLLGGGAANVTPNDIEYRLNECFEPMTVNPADPSYTGFMALRKNCFELKNANRVLVEGNIFMNVWAGFSQNGSLIVLTPKNQGGAAPIATVKNVIIRYNFGSTANAAVQIANVASDSGALGTAGNTYSRHDNIWENLNNPLTCYKCSTNSGGAIDGGDLSTLSSPAGFVLNTLFANHEDYIPAAGAFQMGGTLGISGPSTGTHMFGFTWTNMIAPKESQGINNPLDGCGSGAANCSCNNSTPATILNSCFPGGYTFGGNTIVNTGTTGWPGSNCTSETSFANLFVNYNNGFNGPQGVLNYLVKTTSKCHNSALDGRDPGADVLTLANRIKGVGQFQ